MKHDSSIKRAFDIMLRSSKDDLSLTGLTSVKNIFAHCQDIVHYQEPLANHTSFGIGGRAEIFVTPKTLQQLREIYRLCHKKRIPIYILGKGTNLLVNDRGVKGVVLKSQWFNIERKGDERLIVSAAYPLPKLINDATKMGLSGLEPLVGIPGTLGGAVVMNAGGKWGQIADVIDSVNVINKDGRIKTLYARKGELQFDYRYSNLAPKGFGGRKELLSSCRQNILVSEVVIRLKSSGTGAIRKRIKEILDEKKMTQPLNARSAGCVFRNQPCYSVGALIDRAGLKGVSVGGAKVSTKHANFIVNDGNAKASDVMQLIKIIKKTIRKKFKVNLGLEIEVW
ncbi:MAG: UDP-N-acetylmuramate dehydrogenase [Planctomycetota bacterium]